MSNENFDNTDDLDSFSDELFGQSKSPTSEAPASAVEEEVEDSIDDDAAPIEQDVTDADGTGEDDEDEVVEETPKPKKNRTQERIEQLLEKERLQKERADALEARLAALEQPKAETPKPQSTLNTDGPTPDDKNEDGTDKYPLGEFDPNYHADKTKFMFEEAWKAKEAEQAKAIEAQRNQEEQAKLQQSWQNKLDPAKERYPDFMEKGEELVQAFEGINQAYGDYLGATLMSMEFGPDVLYYLANNLDEAKKIIAMGPTAATIALGRLEGKFADADVEKQKARPKVSKAPTPPPANKGASAATPEIPDDTDDLDAFAEKLFKKRK